MAPKAKTIRITLYAPSIDVTVEDFHLAPAQPHATLLKKISTALGNISQAWPYSLKHEPIEDFKALEEGQTLLIATCYFERPLAEEVRDVMVVQPGAPERSWMALEDEKKKAYVASRLDKKVYLTLTYHETWSRLTAPSAPTIKTCLAIMEDSWGLPIDAILAFPGMIMPYGEMETWEADLLHVLAVLSEATLGQGIVVSGLIFDEVRRKRICVVEGSDLLEVGKQLYREATHAGVPKIICKG